MDILTICANAKEIFLKIFWPDGPTCPFCSSNDYYILSDGRYKCKDCGKIFSITTNTIAHHSHISIDKWIVALYLILDGRGISSVELGRRLGVTQKSAFYMMMKLRFLFFQDETVLTNEIAMDEVFLGGTWSKMSLQKRNFLLDQYMLPTKPKTVAEKMAIANKVNSLYKRPIFGMNDGEKLVLKHMPNGFLQEDVVKIFNDHSCLFGEAVSDCSYLYDRWEELTTYTLHQNNHSNGIFVSDNGSSSNRIEGSFSLLKRGILHTYCSVSSKYLQLYLDEICFRFNYRKKGIIDKLNSLLRNRWVCKINYINIKNYYGLSKYPSRIVEIFNPYEFFKGNNIIKEIIRDNIVYRREDFV